MQSNPLTSLSPSFTTYSSGTLADIAARVVEEFRLESGSDFDDLYGLGNPEKLNDAVAQNHPTIEEEDEVDDDDFEFPSVCKEPAVQSISADEIFCDGQIRPVFPVFGRNDLLVRGGVVNSSSNLNCSKASSNPSAIRNSLRSLMREEREPTSSCSSSESADDLDGVPAETYCAWTPKSSGEMAPERWNKKSGSTGSTSKRWRIRELLRRSNSDGRIPFVFLSSNLSPKKKETTAAAAATEKSSPEKGKVKGEVVPVTAAQEEEEDYGVATAGKGGGDRRRSYGGQGWVGFFANANGLGSNLHPF